MQLVKDSAVIITSGRQRQEFNPDAMAELTEGIRIRGLMHPIVMRETPEGLVLVAGERRMRAMRDIRILGGVVKHNGQEVPDEHYPYVTLGQLSPLEAEEAELEENAQRADLTWQEKAAAMSKLHSLRSRQAQAEGRVHTVADTAMETKGRADGGFQAQVRKDLIVAQHLNNPAVAKAKTAEEAFKILKKQETSAANLALAASVGKTFSQSIHELHNTNCLSWMRSQQEGQFDVILTDPPYGMGADSFGDAAGKLSGIEHHYKDDLESFQALMGEWCPLAYRIAKAQAHAYVFCDLDNFHWLKIQMTAAGWWVTRTPFIATKPNSGRVPHPEHGPRRQWEMILYAIKGKKTTQGIYPDVITTFADANMSHGAQKPVALYVDLLKRSVRPGDNVLDSFAGSGTIFPAAHQLKVKAVGIEMNPEYYAMGLKRLQELDSSTAYSATQANALGNELQSLIGK